MKRQFLLALVLPWSAYAGGIGGPVVGYVPEPAARAVRPILGIPGASLPGERVPVGLEMLAAHVSPRHDYMLAAAADGSMNVVDLRDGSARRIEGARPAASRIALSPGGGTAALFAGSALQVIHHLPAEPAVSATIEAAEAGAFAVSDDGTLLYDSGGILFAVAPGGNPHPIPFAGQAALIAFLEGTRDALVAGRDDNQLALLRDVTGAPAYRWLAGASEGIDTPAGLAFSNNRALVATRDSVVAVDLETGTATATPCACAVTGLDRMRGAALFRVTGFGAGPLWLFDAAENRFLFVPAPAAEVAR